MASNLYLPVLEMIWPLIADDATNDSIMGVRINPACVADPPITPWEKTGTYRMAPNIPIAVKNKAQTDTIKTLLRKRLSDKIGLLTFLSMRIKINKQAKERIRQLMICHEDHS